MILTLPEDEIYSKTIKQSSSRNVHHVTSHDNKRLVIILTLDGTISRFIFDDSSQILHLNDEISSVLPLENAKNKEILVISSEIFAISSNFDNFYLIICLNIEEESKLVLLKFEDFLKSCEFCDALSLNYYPLAIKQFKGDNFTAGYHCTFIVSGNDHTLNVYTIDKNKNSIDFFENRSIFFHSLKLPGSCLCIDFVYFSNFDQNLLNSDQNTSNFNQKSTNFDYFWCALGLETGDLLIFKLTRKCDVSLVTLNRKFDTPVSVVSFLNGTNEKSNLYDFYLLTSSSLGPALIFGGLKTAKDENKSEIAEFSNLKLIELLKLPKSNQFDVIVTSFFDQFSNVKEDFAVCLGTFSYHFLIYRVNLSSKICQLMLTKEFLSPVIKIFRMSNWFVVVTCNNLFVFDIKN